MRCWSARRRLSAYIDGELPAARRERLVRHLAGCPACAARERELRGAWDDLGALRVPDEAPDLWSGVLERLAEPRRTGSFAARPRPFLVPAALAACALVGLIGGALFALRLEALSGPRMAAAGGTAPGDTFAEAFGDLGFDPPAAGPAVRDESAPAAARCGAPREDAR
ncbi:MAG: zf-HC2 domain-containing protein [Deltaproteobacteria bacterium]|nr:zf-HC2 domain-containing protein [Deltaproteobacteria bacterium]